MFSLLLQVCAIYYMIFTRKGLSHPGSRYGKGFMVALSFMTALHICNIATHVSTHRPHLLTLAQYLLCCCKQQKKAHFIPLSLWWYHAVLQLCTSHQVLGDYIQGGLQPLASHCHVSPCCTLSFHICSCIFLLPFSCA